ncbi:MAG TPA: molybdenum cofactor guanylyltransferase [Candidatus Didemnitutus sp.]|nr:molybdenum cofactor guanylyltransferase [Candidatus Didemnitutus sp.]
MSQPVSGLAGVVLAGGESRRMGRDKAELEVDGVRLIVRQLDVLRACGAAPLVVSLGSAARTVLPNVASVPDRYPNAGPLAGIHAAFEALHTPYLAVLAVDMPRIEAGWFTWLHGLSQPGTGVVAQHASGQFEPLAAIYPREALAEMEARLRRGELPMQSLVAGLINAGLLRVAPLPEDERWRTTNWNSPEDVGR